MHPSIITTKNLSQSRCISPFQEPISFQNNRFIAQSDLISTLLNEQDKYFEARETARLKYKPDRIERLLIDESPPESFKRFFYSEKIRKNDQLYLSTMKVLYPCAGNKELHINKESFLRSFMENGFYVIDAVDCPLPLDTNYKKRRNIVWDNRHALVEKMRRIITDKTEVILIKVNVYDLYDFLKAEGFNVINNCPIELPGTGYHKEYLRKLGRLIKPLSAESVIKPTRAVSLV